MSPGDKPWSLRDVDPNWDGGCPCADGLVPGFHVEVDSWRTGPQKGGAIHVWKQATCADVPHGLHYLRPIDIAAHVHAALVAGWPGVDVWIFLEDEPPFLWGCE